MTHNLRDEKWCFALKPLFWNQLITGLVWFLSLNSHPNPSFFSPSSLSIFLSIHPSIHLFFLACYFRMIVRLCLFYLPQLFLLVLLNKAIMLQLPRTLMWYPIPWIRFRRSSIDGARVEVRKNWFLNLENRIRFSWNTSGRRDRPRFRAPLASSSDQKKAISL